jgi:hypothetical protein
MATRSQVRHNQLRSFDRWAKTLPTPKDIGIVDKVVIISFAALLDVLEFGLSIFSVGIASTLFSTVMTIILVVTIIVILLINGISPWDPKLLLILGALGLLEFFLGGVIPGGKIALAWRIISRVSIANKIEQRGVKKSIKDYAVQRMHLQRRIREEEDDEDEEDAEREHVQQLAYRAQQEADSNYDNTLVAVH